jgi:molecular chaperone GrpE
MDENTNEPIKAHDTTQTSPQTTPIDPKEQEIENLKKQLAEVTESGKRIMADMTNLKRRTEDEKLKTIIYANANLLRLILPALDNLKRAITHSPDASSEWVKGIEMAIRQLEKALADSGLKKIEADAQEFDPEKHEAIMEGSGELNKVIEVLEDGYMLGDYIIRHAKVKIGNGS